jgi:hypothetical protein
MATMSEHDDMNGLACPVDAQSNSSNSHVGAMR